MRATRRRVPFAEAMAATGGMWLLAMILAVPFGARAAPNVSSTGSVAGEEEGWEEEETDELPFWAEEERDAPIVLDLSDYGSGIPSPEDVASGARPVAPLRASEPRSASVPAPPATQLEFDDFRTGLEPHGRWVHTPEYGRVFVPDRQTQVAGWRPYLYGQWVWTSYGWTWASDEPFGWATYHYGRWAYASAFGWMWVPGYTWGPAWVAWRHADDGVVGWAPLYPGYVRYTTSYPVFADHWIFVGSTHFYGHPIHRHWHRDRSSYYYSRSVWSRNWRPVGRGGVYSGPPRRHVERVSRGRIHETKVIPVRSPERRGLAGRSERAGGELRVYRPANRAVRGSGGSVTPGAPKARERREASRPNSAPRVAPKTNPSQGPRPAPSRQLRSDDRPKRETSPGERPRRSSPPAGGEAPRQGRSGSNPDRSRLSTPNRPERPALERKAPPQQRLSPSKPQRIEPPQNRTPSARANLDSGRSRSSSVRSEAPRRVAPRSSPAPSQRRASGAPSRSSERRSSR